MSLHQITNTLSYKKQQAKSLMKSKIYPKAKVLSYVLLFCSGTLPSAIKMVLIGSLRRKDFVCCVIWMTENYFTAYVIANYIV